MKKIQLVYLATLIATGIAHASTPCNGFEFKVKNNLPDDLITINIQLNGAEIQPAGIQTLNSKSETVFRVNGSTEDRPMNGEFVFHTVSLPSKTVNIKFALYNRLFMCEHIDTSPNHSDYPLEKTRWPNKVNYTIG